MGLSYDTYGTVPTDEERFAILDHAHEMGSTFWDSSAMYGDSEELIVWICQKKQVLSDYHSGEFCKKAFDESLKLLGIGSIELYYIHHANPKTPIEETMRALSELKAQGKIKHIGLPTISSATLRRAVKIAPVTAVQMNYSPFVLEIRLPEGTDLLATCRELGVTIVAAMPLGRGMLTSTFEKGEPVGNSKDKRVLVMPRFMGENREKNTKIAGQFKALADKKGCTLPQLALAWLAKQGNYIIPNPVIKRLKYLEENWASVDVHLTDEEEREVRNFVETAEIAGTALPPQFKEYNFRDTAEEA